MNIAYVHTILISHMYIFHPTDGLYPKYQGLPISPTRSATYEMMRHDLDLEHVLEVLVEGYDCSPGHRSRGVIERCLDVKGRTRKVVVVDSIDIYTGNRAWALIHVGIFSKR